MTNSARRWTVAAMLAMVLAACGGDDKPEAKTDESTTTSRKVTFDKEADDLLSLLEDARSLTFHAVYSATNAANATFEIQIWRKDGKIRQDINAKDESGAALLQRAIASDGKTTQCSKAGDDPWQCQTVASAGDANDSDAVFGAVRDQLTGLDVAKRTETVDGRSVTCFAWQSDEAEDSKGEMCVLNNGLPVRATVGATSLVLVTEQSDVGDDAFVAPAPST